jgi:serine phosphatase RsbU (regulator of sigma subunit)
MSRAKRDSELRVGGLHISMRFTLIMSLALTVVMSVAALLLYSTTSTIAQSQQEQMAVDAVKVLADFQALEQAERDKWLRAKERGETYTIQPIDFWEQVESNAVALSKGEVLRFRITYGGEDSPGYLYQYKPGGFDREGSASLRPTSLIVPERLEQTGQGLFGLIIGITIAVILVGAAVAFMVGKNVSKPLEHIVEDIRQISRGDLHHRSRVQAGGEIALLARSIDRMASDLDEAQEAQLELSVRERELAVAEEVREALLSEHTPVVDGYDLGATHVDSPKPGGDFHDFIERADGRMGLLVCGVSGQGIPGAMIGAIARSYLRVELETADEVGEALKNVNRYLARDVRRGMFVTALYALLNPGEGTALLACAGHKVPLIRYSASDQKIRLLQPEGIALAFDKGPVFDRTLEVLKVPIEPGDRLVLSNTGPLQVLDPEGREFGEKAFYRSVLQCAGMPTPKMLRVIRQSLEQFAGSEPFPNDISIVTVVREA